MTRVAFTKKELEMILDMWAVASAAPWGEGDYADGSFAKPDAEKTFNALSEKLSVLRDRKNRAAELRAAANELEGE